MSTAAFNASHVASPGVRVPDHVHPVTRPLPPEYQNLRKVDLPPFLPSEGWEQESKTLLMEALSVQGGDILVPVASDWYDRQINPSLIPFYQYESQRLKAHSARVPLVEAMLKAQMTLPEDIESLTYEAFVDELDNRLEEKREDLHGRARLGKGMIAAIVTLKTGLSLPFVTTMVQGLGMSWGPITLLLAGGLSLALGFVPTLLWQTWYGLFEQTFGRKDIEARIMAPGDTIFDVLVQGFEPTERVNVIGRGILLLLVTLVLGVAGYAWVQVDAHTFEQLQHNLGMPMALTLTIGLFGAALAIAIQKHHLAQIDHQLTRIRTGILDRVKEDLITVWRDYVPLDRADAIISAMSWAVKRVSELTAWVLIAPMNTYEAQNTFRRLLDDPKMPVPLTGTGGMGRRSY